jgi:hypothetical protein
MQDGDPVGFVIESHLEATLNRANDRPCPDSVEPRSELDPRSTLGRDAVKLSDVVHGSSVGHSRIKEGAKPTGADQIVVGIFRVIVEAWAPVLVPSPLEQFPKPFL